MTAPRILVTGFDPFGELSVNTSQLVVEHLAQTTFDRFRLDTGTLPTAYGRSFAAIERQFGAEPPDAVLMFGVAGTVDRFSLETRAANVRSIETPDNDGLIPEDASIDPSGPDAMLTRVDTDALLVLLEARGIDAHLSEDAGDFLCNFTYYTLLRWIDAHGLGMPALFVHVPDLSNPDGETIVSPALAQLQEDAATLLRLFAALVLEGETRTA